MGAKLPSTNETPSIPRSAPGTYRLTPSVSGRRFFSFAGVAVIHLALILAVAVYTPLDLPVFPARVIQVTVFKPQVESRLAELPPWDWGFEEPQQVFAPEPQFTILPDEPVPQGIVATAINERLAPRPEPGHINERPQLPSALGSLISSLKLELRILVLPDGSIGNAQVKKSTGMRDIDQLAILFVKANWIYLPASVNGSPVEAWTTVFVRFAAM